MSSDSSSQLGVFDRVHDFVVANANNELTEKHWSDFEQLLLENDDACRLYYRYVQESGYLQTIFDAMPDEDSPLSDVFSLEQQAPDILFPIATFPASLFHSTPGYFSSGGLMAYFAAMVIVGIGLAILAVIPVSQATKVASHSPSAIERQQPVVQKEEIVGRITGMVDCEWEKAGTGPTEFPLPSKRAAGGKRHSDGNSIQHSAFTIHRFSPVSLGDKFVLVSGLLEITYDTGAKVILQGPVTYKVESAASGFLSVGKLTALLEKKATSLPSTSEIAAGGKGGEPFIQHSSVSIHPLFAVRTPTAVVTDLGTEFGVQVDQVGTTTSTVFRGSVAMKAICQSRGFADSEIVLHKNESACVQKFGHNVDDYRSVISRTTNGPSGFVRKLPQHAANRDGEAYAQLVLSMKPVVYYRTEKPAEQDSRRVLFDSASGDHHGELLLADQVRSPFGPGRFGEALYLHGPMTNDHAIVRQYPETDNEAISASVWVWADTLDAWGTIIQGKPLASTTSDPHVEQFFLGVNPDLALTAIVVQRNGNGIRVCERGTVLPRGRWQHVAMVADGTILHLYRNGVEVASSPCDGVDRRIPAQILAIGGLLVDFNGELNREYSTCWCGRLDEIAVFNHTLSAAQVRQLSVRPAAENEEKRGK